MRLFGYFFESQNGTLSRVKTERTLSFPYEDQSMPSTHCASLGKKRSKDSGTCGF